MKTRLFTTPLHIPEGKSGKWEIKHKVIEAGSEIPIVSMRDALFSGKKAVTAKLADDIIIHQLYEDGGLWMTDTPQEQESHKHIVEQCRGDVLIGGLGLGYIASMLDKKKDVNSITVVEIDKDVINLVWKHLHLKKAKIVHADLFKYLKMGKDKFDWAYYDIWTPTGEDILYTHIRPLKTLSKGKIPFDHILCWEEATMLGQIMLNLSIEIQLKESIMLNMTKEEFINYKRWSRTKWPFYNYLRTVKPCQQVASISLKHYVKTYTNEARWKPIWGKYERIIK